MTRYLSKIQRKEKRNKIMPNIPLGKSFLSFVHIIALVLVLATFCSSNAMNSDDIGMALLNAVSSITKNSFTPVKSSTTNSDDDEKKKEECSNKVDVGLNEVPETMLWTLHNRAGEIIKGTWGPDDKCVEIYRSIDYDYERSFGPSEESHALRSYLFDEHIVDFWKSNPGGSVVINLGEGLETQRYRLEEQREQYNSLWVTVDVSSAIEARERFIRPDKNHLHVTESALEVDAWVRKIPNSHQNKPVFITAQGLIMYFEPEDNAKMFASLAKHFPNSTILFDSLAKFVSDMTLKEGGWQKTPHYTTPRMPTGANRFDSEALFQGWVPDSKVEYVYWPTEKSSTFFMKYVVPIFVQIPFLNNYQPGIVWAVTFPPSSSPKSKTIQ